MGQVRTEHKKAVEKTAFYHANFTFRPVFCEGKIVFRNEIEKDTQNKSKSATKNGKSKARKGGRDGNSSR